MRYLIQNNPNEIAFFENKLIVAKSILKVMNTFEESAKGDFLSNIRLYQEVEENKFILVPVWQFPELFADTPLKVKRA